MKQFLLLLKGKKTLDYSPEQLQERLEEYREWITTIEPHYISDNRLERKGAHLKQKDQIALDGPFLEAKEIIAGFIIIQADNLAQATHLCNNSPLLKYFEIYIRPMISSQ